MAAIFLKGAEVGKKLVPVLREEAKAQAAKDARPPTLGLVRVGAAKDAEAYEKAILRIMTEVGLLVEQVILPEGKKEVEVLEEISRLSQASEITGILVLSPVPAPINYSELTRCIPAHKDVEGTRSSGFQESGVYPPTALSILELALASGGSIEGREAVVIGRSLIVGKPAAKLLLDNNATVTICHSKTRNLESHVRRADILVAAVGKAGLVKGEWVKPGAIVIDAGENMVNGKMVGDVEFEKAAARAGFITPVPSGVGPLTTYMLARNLIALSKAKKSNGNH